MEFNLLKKQQSKPQQQPTNLSQYQLSTSEIETILKILQNSMFPIKDIEPLYVALYKLQEQYKTLNDGIKS